MAEINQRASEKGLGRDALFTHEVIGDSRGQGGEVVDKEKKKRGPVPQLEYWNKHPPVCLSPSELRFPAPRSLQQI